MSVLNTEIKPFKASAYKNGQFIELTEADVKGKWAVFFFYPADFTFVCPTELGDVADHYAEFQKLGVEIYSVSTDTHFVHKAWADAARSVRSSAGSGAPRSSRLRRPPARLSMCRVSHQSMSAKADCSKW